MAITPNMNLSLPTVGETSGPQWATDINAALNVVDQHNHSAGSGVPITPDGLNINSELPLSNNSLTGVKSVNLQLQGSALSDLRSIYTVGNDLYFTDALGNQIQITEGGGVAGTPGSIANLTSPASASYISASSKFVFQSNTNTAADIDAGAIIMRNLTASSFGLTLTPPTLSSNYTLTLPSLPVSQKIMTLDASGNIAAPYVVDNSTIEINSNTIRVKDDGITLAKMADNSVDTDQLVDEAVTKPKLAPLDEEVSNSSGGFTTSSSTPVDVTNLSFNITTTGRPVFVFLQPAGSTSSGKVSSNGISGDTNNGILYLLRDGTIIAQFAIDNSVQGVLHSVSFPPSSVMYLDTGADANVHTYKIQASASLNQIEVANCKLVAFET